MPMSVRPRGLDRPGDTQRATSRARKSANLHAEKKKASDCAFAACEHFALKVFDEMYNCHLFACRKFYFVLHDKFYPMEP